MAGLRSIVCGGIDKHGLSLAWDVAPYLSAAETPIHAADLLVESFDAFNEPSLRFNSDSSRAIGNTAFPLPQALAQIVLYITGVRK
jgi:hypothetical protein